MITKKQAEKLRALIEDYAEAKAEEAHAGAQPPAEADAIRLYARHAGDLLSVYIQILEGR